VAFFLAKVLARRTAHYWNPMTSVARASLLIVLLSLLYGCSNPSQAQSEQAPTASPERTPTAAVSVDEFYQAAHDGKLDLVKNAISSGIEVNAPDEQKRTALMLASFNGHEETVSYLIEQGADVNALDSNGRTALMFASSGPFPKTVEVLIKNGSDVNAIDTEEKWTALMFAAGEGQTEVCKALLEGGADPTLKDDDGDTAASHAKANNHAQTVELLTK
jgi:ankyrin repeat protein